LFSWFGRFIKSEEVRVATRKAPNYFVRKYKFPWYDVLLFLIFRCRKCIGSELSQYYSQLGLSQLRISRQAAFKAIKKVDPSVFKLLIHKLAERFYQSDLVKTYKGYILLAEDGTTINFYKTNESLRRYGWVFNQHTTNEEKAKKATSRSAALYDITNGLIIDFAMKRFKDSEIPIAIEQLDTIPLLQGHPAIYLADRYYGSVELFSMLESHGLKYCIRGKSNFFKHYIEKMKTNDEWIKVNIDAVWRRRLKYDQVKKRFSLNPYINIRVVKHQYDIYKKGKKESVDLIYFTNLSHEEFDSSDIMHLYSKRWEIETGYKTLKTDLEWERYFSKDCGSETCSIYAKVIFHNLSGILRKEMDKELIDTDLEVNKYKYQTNWKQLNELIRDEKLLRWIRNENPERLKIMIELIKILINKIKVPVRPNRHYKRWHRVIKQGKPMRFRLDGRDWPNTRPYNGLMMTVPPS
jgi:transposase DDE domain